MDQSGATIVRLHGADISISIKRFFVGRLILQFHVFAKSLAV